MAMTSVRKNGDALQYIDKDTKNYVNIVKSAI